MSFKISVIVPAHNAEEHLSEALDSLVNQTFRDFEVVIINDGSTDQTQDIIDEYCLKYNNFKSFTQSNLGVSGARNKGIDEASGEYITFLDADDLFSLHALEKLYESAVKTGAELVIGISSHFNSFTNRTHVNTVNLSKKEQIDPFDNNLVWTFSQSNKLFLREKIIETGLKFPDLKYAEDGVFVLAFEYQCSKITGCPHKVLFYRKHDFWEGVSATQRTDIKHINDFLKAHALMYNNAANFIQSKIKNAKTTGEKNELTAKYYVYLNELLYRRTTLFFSDFYRLFWKTDSESLKIILDNILCLKGLLFPQKWNRIKKLNPDIFIKGLTDDQSTMAENPIVTLVLNPEKISRDNLNSMIDSIYIQDLPAFELLIHEDLSNKLSEDIIKKENLHFIDSKGQNFRNVALKRARGDYIIFVDDYIILNPVAFRTFFNCMYNKNYDMISAKIRRLSNYKILEYTSQELAYSYRNTLMESRKTKFNYLDLYLNNKVISVDFLKKIRFEFSDDQVCDVKRLYNMAKYKKILDKCIFSTKNEKELLKSLKSNDKSNSVKISFLSLIKRLVYDVFKLRRYFKHGIRSNS
ncbi:MAG: glycosyltransferase [Methanobacterium sp.]